MFQGNYPVAHRADALEIEAGAKRRLADEYDAAQERGEFLANGERTFSSPEKVKGTEVIPPKDLHGARIIRDAEVAEPQASFALCSRWKVRKLSSAAPPSRQAG